MQMSMKQCQGMPKKQSRDCGFRIESSASALQRTVALISSTSEQMMDNAEMYLDIPLPRNGYRPGIPGEARGGSIPYAKHSDHKRSI